MTWILIENSSWRWNLISSSSAILKSYRLFHWFSHYFVSQSVCLGGSVSHPSFSMYTFSNSHENFAILLGDLPLKLWKFGLHLLLLIDVLINIFLMSIHQWTIEIDQWSYWEGLKYKSHLLMSIWTFCPPKWENAAIGDNHAKITRIRVLLKHINWI